MNQILISILAVIPGLLISYLIYRMDKFEKEPPLHLVLCFVAGMLITVPAMFLEEQGAKFGWEESGSLFWIAMFAVFIVALSEEIMKFLVLILYPYQQKFFNEPMDGIIYAVMISMGFATVENLLYADRFGLETTITRAFTAVPAHAVFAIISGYFVGLAKFNPEKKIKYLSLAFSLPILIHGIYNFFILQNLYEWMMGIAIFVLGVSAFFAWQFIRKHQDDSPFKNPPLETAATNSAPTISATSKTETDDEIMDDILDELNEREDS